MALAGVVALGGVTHQADAAITEKVVFASDRTTGTGVNNPTGDFEIYLMNSSDGTVKKNLTNNGADVFDFYPFFSPGGKKVAYSSSGKHSSNPEGDKEIYRMSALDGTGKKNLTDNAAVDVVYPD